MEIREISKPEIKDLLSLYDHLHSQDDPLPDKKIIENIWSEIISNPNLIYFGAFEDGKLLSSCALSIIPNLTRACRPYGLIENVVTHIEFRRKGHGKRVLKKALEYAWSHNCYKVMLLSGRKDEGTFNFYESVGFDRTAKQAFLAKPDIAENGA